MTILAGLFMLLFERLLGRWKGALAALVGMILYAVLVGPSASVIRAAVMSGLSLFAVQLGRRQSGLNSLALAAALMAAVTPMVLWDVGFQLSFMATLGLVLYADPILAFTMNRLGFLNRRLPPAAVRRIADGLGEFFLFTLAAQVTTLPVMIYHFQRLSLVSFIANPLVLPAQPAVMVLGGLAVLLGLVWLPLGQAAAYLAWPFAAYTIRVVEGLATWPNASWNVGRLALPVVLLFYTLLFACTFGWPRLKARLTNLASAVGPAVPLAVVSLVTILVWQAALHSADGRLHLILLDTNTSSQAGEALLIQSPTGRWLLINGGPSPTRLSEALGRHLPITSRRLDALVVAGTAEAQLAALPGTLERFLPRTVLWAGPTQASRSSRSLQELFVSMDVPEAAAEMGQRLDLGGGAELQVIYVSEQGAVLLLEWDHFRALIPLGLEYLDPEALEYGRRIGPVSALLLAEGGYAPVNPPEWIANLHPQVVLASVTIGSRRVLPSPETLVSLEGYTLLRTDRNGWIEIETDGQQMWVERSH